jgi:hypothetical protein
MFSDDTGVEDHNYVRRVEDHPRPKTLQIGPLSIQEVDELVTFFRGRMDFSGGASVKRQQLSAPEFFYPPLTVVRSSMDNSVETGTTID